jgi:hypothetical protein
VRLRMRVPLSDERVRPAASAPCPYCRRLVAAVHPVEERPRTAVAAQRRGEVGDLDMFTSLGIKQDSPGLAR